MSAILSEHLYVALRYRSGSKKSCLLQITHIRVCLQVSAGAKTYLLFMSYRYLGKMFLHVSVTIGLLADEYLC